MPSGYRKAAIKAAANRNRSKARYYRRRTKARGGRMALGRTSKDTGMPPSFNIKLKYNDNFTFASTFWTSHVYSGNSLFDPDFTGVGGQPLGYDELSAIYGRYRVNACKIKVTFYNYNTTTASIGNIGITASPEPSIAANMSAQIEQNWTKTIGLGVADGGGGVKTLSMYMPTSTVTGVSKQTVRTDDNFQALITANPSQRWYYQVWGGSADESSSINIRGNVSLLYYATFQKPKLLAQS